MLIDTDTTVTMTEANQNFSRVARLASERGPVVVMRNNKPSYLVTDLTRSEYIDDDELDQFADRFIDQYRPALEILAA